MDLDKQRLEIAKALSGKLNLPANKIVDLQKIQAKFVVEGMKQMLPVKLLYLGSFKPSQSKIEKRNVRKQKGREKWEQRNKQVPGS